VEEQGLFQKGDSVRMHGQECTGEVVKITHRYITVAFDAMEVNISPKRLEKALRVTVKASTMFAKPTVRMLNSDANTFTSYNPEIDLHGMSVSQALSTLDRWIDKASLLGHKQLKIIHGKGMGILRKAIRTHLQSHGQVSRIIDKHPYLGGEGVTFLELD